MRKIATRITPLALLAAALLVSACNTVAGIGRDVEAVGEAVAETAEDVRS